MVANYASALRLTNKVNFFKRWESGRIDLLNLLTSEEENLRVISKWCARCKIIGCGIESVCKIASFFAADKNTDSCIFAGMIFGGLGFLSTVFEMQMHYLIFKNIVEHVEEDKESFTPIQNLWHQNEELKNALIDIFPFDKTEKVVSKFSSVANEVPHLSPSILIFGLMKFIIGEKEAEKKEGEKREDEKTKNEMKEGMIKRSSTQNMSEFGRELTVKETGKRTSQGNFNIPFVFDLSRCMLYCTPLYYVFTQNISSPLYYVFTQNIKEVDEKNHQKLTSWTVFGRILLNAFSILNAAGRLVGYRGLEMHGLSEMLKLKNHLKEEVTVLQEIMEIKKAKIE